MHKDFRYEPPHQSLFTKERLIAKAGYIGTASASAALRSYIALAEHSGDNFPAMKIGRIQVAERFLHSHNNIDQEIGDPMLMQVIRTKCPQGHNISLLIFSDKTALIAQEEKDFDPRLQLMRVLPVVLRISNNAEILSSHRVEGRSYKVSMEKKGDRLALTMDPDGPAPAASEKRAASPEEHGILLQAALVSEIQTWAAEIDNYPLVGASRKNLLQGTYGEDAEAPCPSLDGKNFARPAVLAQVNFTAEQYKEATHFIRLAIAHAYTTHSDQIKDFVVGVLMGEPNQIRGNPKVQVKLRVIAHNHNHEEIEAAMTATFFDLLKHPKVPRYVSQISGHTVCKTEGDAPLSRTRPYMIYHGEIEEVSSHHNRLAAHAIFASTS